MTLRRDSGYILITYADSDVVEEYKTVQCVHCGGHYIPRPGSGIVRGYCYNCDGPICGPKCKECVPEEVLLENFEKFRPLDFRPIVAAAFREEHATAKSGASSLWLPTEV